MKFEPLKKFDVQKVIQSTKANVGKETVSDVTEAFKNPDSAAAKRSSDKVLSIAPSGKVTKLSDVAADVEALKNPSSPAAKKVIEKTLEKTEPKQIKDNHMRYHEQQAAENYAKNATKGDGYEKYSLAELRELVEQKKADYDSGKTHNPILAAADWIVGGPTQQVKDDYTKVKTAYENRLNAVEAKKISMKYGTDNLETAISVMEERKNAAKSEDEKNRVEEDIRRAQKALYGESNVLKTAGKGAYYGVVLFDKQITSALDFAIGNLAKAFGWQNNPISKLNQYTDAELNRASEDMQKSAIASGDKYNISGQISGGVVSALPQALIAVLTGGKNAVSSIGSAAQTGKGIAFAAKESVKGLVKNPMYWTSFASTVGMDYEEAKKNGASEGVAIIYALLTSTMNAVVEIGGGIETLPNELKHVYGKKNFLLKWLKSSIEEGGEEVVQDLISQMNAKLFYDQDKEIASLTNDEAVINPIRSLKEGAMGAAVGGILGGGQLSFETIVNAKSNSYFRSLGSLLQKTGQADELVAYAQNAEGDIFHELAQKYKQYQAPEILGNIYATICRDVDLQINSPERLDIALDNYQSIVSDNLSKSVVGIASSQMIDRLVNAGIDTESAQYMTDEIQDNDLTGRTESTSGISDSENMILSNESKTEKTAVLQSNANEAEEGLPGAPAEGEAAGAETGGTVFREPPMKEIAQKGDLNDYIKAQFDGSTPRGSRQLHLEQVAGKLGLRVHWDESISRGKYSHQSRTVFLNPKMPMGNMYYEVFKHEFTHSLETKKDFSGLMEYLFVDSNAFEEWVEDRLKQIGEETQGTREEKIERLQRSYFDAYKNSEEISGIIRKQFTKENAGTEMAADFVGDWLFVQKGESGNRALSNESGLDFLVELAQNKPNLFQRIKEWVREVIDRLKGAAQNRSVEEDLAYLEKKLVKVYQSVENKKAAEAGGVSYSFGVTQREIDEYVKKAKIKENKEDYKKYAEVSEKLIEDVKDDIDVSGYVHALRDNDIRHIFNSHGENTNEKYPVTEPDIEKIPYIIENYDKVYFRFSNKGKPSLLYVKTLGDNNVYYVEQALENYNGEKLLINKQLIKTGADDIPNVYFETITKRQSKNDFLADLDQARKEHAQSVNHNYSTNSVPTSAENVKENSENGKFSIPITPAEKLVDQYEKGKIDRETFIKRLNNNLEETKAAGERYAKRVEKEQRRLLNQANTNTDAGSLAWKLKRQYRSTTSQEELKSQLSELLTLAKAEKRNWDGINRRAAEIAKDIAESSALQTERTDWASDILKDIRSTAVSLDQVQMQTAAYDSGSYEAFRKTHFGKMNITKDGVPLEIQWKEWSERFPELFDPDINSGDMPLELSRIIGELQDNYKEYDTEAATKQLIGDITDWAVKNSRTVAEEKFKQNDAFNKKMERQRERRSKTELKNKILHKAERFNRMLTKPREDSHVPKDLVVQLIDVCEFVNRDMGYEEEISNLRDMIVAETDEKKRNELWKRQESLLKRETALKAKIEKISKLYKSYEKDNTYSPVYDDGVEKILDVLEEEIGNTPVSELSRHQLETLNNAMTAVFTVIENCNKMIESRIKAEVDEAGFNWIGEISRAPSLGITEKAKFWMLSPRRAFRLFGNYENDSVSLKIYEDLNDGQKKAMRYVSDAKAFLNEQLKDENANREAQELCSIREKDLVDSGLVDQENGEKIMITKAMRIVLMLHSMNPHNMEHIVSGIKVPDLKRYYFGNKKDAYSHGVMGKIANPATWVADIAKDMTDAELRWMNAIYSYYNEFSQEHLNEVTLKIYGFKKAMVEHYFRIRTDKNFLRNSEKLLTVDGLLESTGFMKERIQGAKNPILLEDAFYVLNDDIGQHSQYYGMVIPLRNLNKVLNVQSSGYEESVNAAIDKKFHRGGKEYIDNLIADLNGARKETDKLDFLNTIRGNYAGAKLIASLPVSFKQAASYPTAAAELDYKSLMKALMTPQRENGKKSILFMPAERQAIAKHSQLLDYRISGNVDEDIAAVSQSKGIASRVMDKAPALFKTIEAFDLATVGRLWYASKYYVEDHYDFQKGSDAYYKKVAEHFERVVENTQPNYAVLQRPEILRNKNPLLKAVTMFKTQSFQNFNILWDSAMNLKAKKKAFRASDTAESRADLKEARGEFAKAVSSQVTQSVVLAVMELVARAMINKMEPYRDEDGEITFLSLLEGVGASVASAWAGILLLGSEVYAAVSAATAYLGQNKSKTKAWDITSPQLETLNNLKDTALKDFKTVVNIPNRGIEENAIQIGKALQQTLKETGEFLGFPVGNITNLGLAIYYDIADAVKGEAFATAVENNKVNEFFGKKGLTANQHYHAMYKALEEGDSEKYQAYYQKLLKSGKKDSDIHSGLLNQYKKSTSVQKQAEGYMEKLDGNGSFESLSGERKDKVQKNITKALATEALAKATERKTDVYDEMYSYRRTGQTAKEKELRQKLRKEGKTEQQINDGFELARYAYMKNVGIDLHEYFLYKQKISESGSRSWNTKMNIARGMDMDSKTKNAIQNNISLF